AELEAADQTRLGSVGRLVPAAARRRAGRPIVLLVNRAGLEVHVILLAPAEREGVAQDHVRFLFTLVDVDVTLEFPLLLPDGELVIRRQEVIFAGDVLDVVACWPGFKRVEGASREKDHEDPQHTVQNPCSLDQGPSLHSVPDVAPTFNLTDCRKRPSGPSFLSATKNLSSNFGTLRDASLRLIG